MYKSIEMINDHLQDEISKSVFANRLLYSSTGDPFYLEKVCETTKAYKKFVEFIKDHGMFNKVLFGTGQWAEWIVGTYSNIIFDYCSDNRKKEDFMGIKYISVDELENICEKICVVITVKKGFDDIRKELIQRGIKESEILCFGELENDAESGIYFDIPELKPSGNDVFIDAGGYDGESAKSFNSWSEGKGRIYFFEPSSISMKLARNTLCGFDNITYIDMGLYSESQVLRFANDGTESKITDDGDTCISVTKLDDYMNGNPATFIKMDIEGAELEALKGAKSTIKKYRPKLAISIYHKSEDIIEIPKLILELNDDYKFWLRHYSMTWFDTVLYAI